MAVAAPAQPEDARPPKPPPSPPEPNAEGTQVEENVPYASLNGVELRLDLQAARVPVSFVKVDDFHTFHTPEASADPGH